MRLPWIAVSIALAASPASAQTTCTVDSRSDWPIRYDGASLSISAHATGALVWVGAPQRAQGFVLDAQGALRTALPAITLPGPDARHFLGARPMGADHLVERPGVSGECRTASCVVFQRLDDQGVARGAALTLEIASTTSSVHMWGTTATRAVIVVDEAGAQDDRVLVLVAGEGGGLGVAETQTVPSASHGACPEGVTYAALDDAHVGAIVQRDATSPNVGTAECPGLVAMIDGEPTARSHPEARLRHVAFEGAALVGLARAADQRLASIVRAVRGSIGVVPYDEATAPMFTRTFMPDFGPALTERVSMVVRRIDRSVIGDPIDLGARTPAAVLSLGADQRLWAFVLEGPTDHATAHTSVVSCR